MSGATIHTDQIGREVEILKGPQRIISLVPSQTELLYDLGLSKRVVGITKFCIHPEDWFKTKTRVGGTKQLHFDVIDSLSPDLIIANKEENYREDIELLERNYPVWVSNVKDLDTALEMIESVSEITNSNSVKLIGEIKTGFDELKPLNPIKKVLYLIWKKPYMAAGSDTFINDMLSRCGFENVLKEDRYPELTEVDIVKMNPDLVFLSSEPFPFGPTHVHDISVLLPNATIQLVDGEMFSWYGSRLKLANRYFGNSILEHKKGHSFE